MSERHVDLHDLRAFSARELPDEEAFNVAWHLFVCPSCRDLLARAPAARALYDAIFGAQGLAQPPEAYSGLVARFAERFRTAGLSVGAAREAAAVLVPRLLAQPHERRRLLIESHPAYQTYAVAERLLLECRRGWSADPARSEELAELALAVADRLDPTVYQGALVNDLRAEAWATIGNCRRIRSDLRKVAEAFELSESFRRQGTGDAMDEADLLGLQASYFIDQRRFPEAEAALVRVIALCHDAEHRHEEGRALVNLARLRYEEGRAEEAVPLLERAAEIVDAEREPRLLLIARRNLVIALSEAGRPEEALARLPAIRRLARDHADAPERRRLLWTQGLIYHRLGHLELAEAALAQAQEGFLAEGSPYDAALITLDLALVHLDAGAPAKARGLAAEMLPIFESRDVHREALAALAIVRRAMEADALTRQVVEEVAAFLRRARRNPGLRFDPST